MSTVGPQGVGPEDVRGISPDNQPTSAPLTTHHSPLTTHHSPRSLALTHSHAAAAAVLAFVFFYLSSYRVWHTDVWAHLRFGEVIVTEHRLPEHEVFSGDFADQERPYLNFQWMAQAGNYLVYRLGARLA